MSERNGTALRTENVAWHYTMGTETVRAVDGVTLAIHREAAFA